MTVRVRERKFVRVCERVDETVSQVRGVDKRLEEAMVKDKKRQKAFHKQLIEFNPVPRPRVRTVRRTP